MSYASTIRRLDVLLVAAGFVLLLPVVGAHRLADFMLFAMFTLSFDLLYGYMGRLSFGHMLYLGIGAYTAMLISQHLSENVVVALTGALIAGVIAGTAVGWIVVRTSGATFALINFALNHVGFFLAVTGLARITGGEDGSPVYLAPIRGIDLANPLVRFWVILACLLLVFYGVKRAVRSPYGTLIQGIKENEERVRFLGFDTFAYKWATFAVSVALAAFTGGLYALNYSYVTPSFVDPGRNVEVIFAALIGGPGTPYGALMGGVVYSALSNYLASYIERWELFLGAALLAIVFRFPHGVLPYLGSIRLPKRMRVTSLP